jgi:hypothetical protein
MTRDEQRAYSRGYNAGRKRMWPAYAPPAPPDPVIQEIVRTSQLLAEKVATWCGAFGEDDEFSKELQPLMDQVDAAQSKLTEWLLHHNGSSAP